ncbi:adenylate/guanylate cyclase domain-containing protein [Chelatococcus reniformis]|uniref:Adenylate cyclase n=1 Tax=Chelatococcus reniformis TaxID=1494448 RepID=A0A916XIY7_9HYPH|nr:adenylate/guanylate cyclase domain-containing protein [Chelatococcus reniformis]GGC73924.1 adenylate cyclase [Chelatococcus reniformis]
MPPRAQAIVDHEMAAAEIMAGWLVFASTLFLGGLYLISPKMFTSMTEMRPVPVAVALGLTIAIIRLMLAYARKMNRGAVLIVTIADFAVLYGLIWSFNWQYGQPASFSLKAPTFLFVFLFIAVRALRFEPWSVITAGLVASVGWIVVVCNALSAPNVEVTHDFDVYLTSNRLLVGAEVEKIVAILLVTGVLTIAIMRGRHQLVTAAVETSATEDLSRFFDPEIADRITNSDLLEPGRGEARDCAVLVTDIRGFSRLVQELDPNDVLKLVVDYQRAMGLVIAGHGGSIDKYLGDGILATFGCTRPSETESADALTALTALVEAAERFKQDLIAQGRPALDIGLSVVAGRVLFGTVGDRDRLEFTVIGEAANLAAKLEKHNKVIGARAVVDRATFERARTQGFESHQFLSRAGETVEGVAAPIDLLYVPLQRNDELARVRTPW